MHSDAIFGNPYKYKILPNLKSIYKKLGGVKYEIFHKI